jgi:hypothetical protein
MSYLILGYAVGVGLIAGYALLLLRRLRALEAERGRGGGAGRRPTE